VSFGRVALAAVLIAAFFTVVALVEDESSAARADHAVALVPANALLYVHAHLDRNSKEWKDAGKIFARFPRLVAERDRLLRGLTRRGGRLDLEREVYPWLDDEAALALLAGADGKARSLILLEVSDPELARAFLSRSAQRPRLTTYRGKPLRIYGTLATSFIGRFLAIGSVANVRSALDVSAGHVPGLVRDSVFARARAGLPDTDRLLFAFAPRSGLKDVIGARGGLVGRLADFLDEPRLEGTAGALRVEGKEVRVDLASALAPVRKESAAEHPFVPTLFSIAPGNAVGYIGTRGAGRVLRNVTRLAGGASLQLPSVLSELRADLTRKGGDILRSLGPLVTNEAALVLSPGAGSAGTLTLAVGGIGPAEGDQLAARLQPVLQRLLSRPVEGQVPTFEPQRIAGANAATIRIAPGLALTYSITGGRALLSTSTVGIRNARSRGPRITDNPLFAKKLLEHSKPVTSVVFLDLAQLLALGEQAGLGRTPGYHALKADLAPIRAATAVTARRGKSRTAAISIEVR
jgi:hypothetical protein